MTFYGPSGWAEWEWANASTLVRGGPVNSISGPVMPNAEMILQDMYAWYNDRVDEPVDEVFRQLQNTLFKNVIAPVEEDVWRRRDSGGASQPRAQGETHLVVTREHVARQVGLVIQSREKLLNRNGLPMDTTMRDDVATRFLNDAKKDFHDSAEQQALQENDRRTGKKESSRESIPGGVGTSKS